MKLIDADELIKYIKIYEIGTSISSDQKEFIDCVNEQPTAFDVNKIVEQLEKLADEANDKILEAGGLQLYYDGYEDAMRTAVEIVKGGGIEYEGLCELADCLDYDVILMTEEHYDCESKSRPDWCPLMDLPEKDNGDYPSNTSDMLALWRTGTSVLMRLQEEMKMIDLTGKSVFVKTQEEYLSVLKMAKLQGFTWGSENNLKPIKIVFPNLLKFYNNKMVTIYCNEETIKEASKIIEDEEKIKDAVSLVRAFTKYPVRTALTDSFIKSLKLLADTVESQMEEVK